MTDLLQEEKDADVPPVEGTARAVELLDEWLTLTGQRDLFSSNEIMDFMLDLRLCLADTPSHEDVRPVPAGVAS